MTLLQHELTDFTVQAFQNNEFHEVTKADVLGHWSVFFFYPADFTFVCPTELEDLAAKYEDFKKIGWRGVVVTLLVIFGTFFMSALFAEVLMRMQGIV